MLEAHNKLRVGVLVLTVAFFGMTCLALKAAQPQRPAVKTDRAVYPQPALPELPKAGTVFVDPTFGAKIMRLTDEVQIDKTGRYLVIKHAKQGKGVIQVLVADLATGKMESLTDDGPDFAPGHSDNGRGTVIGADNWRNCLTFRKLANPHEHHKVLDNHNDWSQDCHLSMLANDERWVLLSFYVGNRLPGSGVFRNEIVQVATDGSQRVRRLAHHRTVYKSYWDSPRANISRDGRFVVFTSTWGGTARRDVFVLEVPPM